MGATDSPPPDALPVRRLTIAMLGQASSTHIRTRARALAKRGHRVVWFTAEPAGVEGVEEVLLTPAEGHGLLFRVSNRATRNLVGLSLSPLAMHRRLIEGLDALRPDLVHVHYAAGLPAWLAAAADRHPLVVSVMGGDVLFGEQSPTTPLGEWLTLEVLRRADLITAKSAHLIDVLDRLGGFGHKAMRLVWGVDLQEFSPRDPTELRRRLGLPEQARIILSPKILQPFYNIHLVIEAMARLPPRLSGTVLLVTEYAADAAYRQELQQRVEALHLQDRVRFVGLVQELEMPLYYSLAEAVVAVPPSDGLPQALFEAMACGAPNVLSRLERYREVVTDPESAVFVDLTPQAIAEGLARVLDDPRLRERIRQRGREIVVETADLDRDVARLERALLSLVQRPESKPRRHAPARMLAGICTYAPPGTRWAEIHRLLGSARPGRSFSPKRGR